MTAQFASEKQRRLFARVTGNLNSIGYRDDLLETEYQYLDYFTVGEPPRKIQAACFGCLPADYETALFGIATSNEGNGGVSLVNSHRALGSPLIFEVGDDSVSIWSVGRDESATHKTTQLSGDEFANWTKQNADALAPAEFLRTKNIRRGETHFFQGSLFAGLIPELEGRIAGILEPRLTAAFQAGMKAYEKETGKSPSEAALFKLAFSILTGKVFFDRRHPKFRSLGVNPSPNDVLERVADHYKDSKSHPLTESTRQAVFSHIWTKMDFRNLSVEVLSQIWSRTLVTEETRDRLGIHRTPYSIARYIVDRMPLEPLPKAGEFILEPCCGSAVFLVAALKKMRDIIGTKLSPLERHKYFRKVLRGFERDPFGIEIGKLCLALSDYPNANHWKIDPADVLKSPDFQNALGSARVVLCNPPYGKFDTKERNEQPGLSVHKPLAILNRVLDSLSSEGVLGFVLPRVFIDGTSYKDVRKRIAARFSNIELVTLPDKGWEFADQETVLLLATHPNQQPAASTQVRHKRVRENDWRDFDWYHRVGSEDSKTMSTAEAEDSLAIPELESIWKYLRKNERLGAAATFHRGIQYNKPLSDDAWKAKLIRTKKFPNSVRGIDPDSAPIYSFHPHLTVAWLDVSDEHKGNNARDYEWDKAKVVVNAVTKSRGKWRMAAFVEKDGLACYQNLTSVWPTEPANVTLFAAILNGPVANAYVADYEGKRHNTIETMKSIPLPRIDDNLRKDIENLVSKYVEAVESAYSSVLTRDRLLAAADSLLRKIDARILTAYGLAPRQQRLLLDYFNEQTRHVPFSFANYFPADLESYYTLEEYMSPKVRNSTIGRLLRTPRPPQSVLDALRSASEMHSK